jgi:lipopolysaccharide export system permease protein
LNLWRKAVVDNGELSEYNPSKMIIQKYILGHLIKLFIAACLVLYGVMLIVEMMRLGQILSIGDLDFLVLALVPMAMIILPMALIFSILMVLERLSVESEIIAMQACGIPKRKLYTPILILSAACMLVHLSISTYLGPMSMQKIQERFVKRAPEKVFSFLSERVFINSFKDITLYVESVNRRSRVLGNVFIESTGKAHTVIAAAKGTMEVKPTGILMKLYQGSVFMEAKKSLRYITFDEYYFLLDADLSRELSIRKNEMATQPQLARLIKEDPQPKYIKEYHNRFAFPLISLILAVVGMQFGIQKPRSPRYTGMVMGIGTITCYYMFFLLADRLVKGRSLDPVLGAWLPDIFFCLILVAVWAKEKLYHPKGGF